MVKNQPANAEDAGLISGSGRSPVEVNVNPLQYSCLGNPMDRGACQAPLPMGFPRQKHWSGLPFPSPGDLPIPGFESASLELAGGFFTSEPSWKPFTFYIIF